jgi:uncharacterized membrane protein
MALDPTAVATPPTDLQSAREARRFSLAGLWVGGLGLVGCLLTAMVQSDSDFFVAFLVIFLAGPLLGSIGLFLAIEELRHGTVERVHAARSARQGMLALALPWLALVVIAGCAWYEGGWD